MTPEELFSANQNIVHYCFKILYHRCPEHLRDDVKQQGYLILWKQCLTFNPDLGYKFSTHAMTPIYLGMKRYMLRYSTALSLTRTQIESGNFPECPISLDACVDDTTDTTFLDFIPSTPDEYPHLTEDMVERFLKTIEKEPDRSILEEWLYGILYYEPPNQEFLSEKYQKSQPAISRVIKKGREKFKKFLERQE